MIQNLLVSMFTTSDKVVKATKPLIVGPEYVETTYTDDQNKKHTHKVEKDTNDSVAQAFAMAASKGKKMCEEQNISHVQGINNTIFSLMNNTAETKIPKAQTIFMHVMKSTRGAMSIFANIVHSNYEQILETDYTKFSAEYLKYLGNYLGFTFDTNVFTNNTPEYTNPDTWFSSRFALYNPAVNFEHVCMIVDLMRNDLIKIDDDIMYAFYYFLYKYVENITEHNNDPEEPDVMRFVIYHCMKLIRVHYINNVTQHGRFNTYDKFTNLGFGAKIDKNIEMYGDARLNTDKDNVLSLFSLSPRTTVDYYEVNDNIINPFELEREPPINKTLYRDDFQRFVYQQKIFFNWNELNTFTYYFTKQAANFCRMINNRKFDKERPAYEMFDYMTSLDIKCRIEYIKSNVYNKYQTCEIDETDSKTKDIVTYILIHNLQRILETKKVSQNPFTDKCLERFVYITYTSKVNGISTVKTVPLGLTLKTLLGLNITPNEHIDQDILDKLNANEFLYIPEVTSNDKGYVERLVVNNKNGNQCFEGMEKQVPRNATYIKQRVPRHMRNKSPQRQRNDSPPREDHNKKPSYDQTQAQRNKFKPYVPSQVQTPTQQNKANEQNTNASTNEDHNMKPSYDQTQATQEKQVTTPQQNKANEQTQAMEKQVSTSEAPSQNPSGAEDKKQVSQHNEQTNDELKQVQEIMKQIQEERRKIILQISRNNSSAQATQEKQVQSPQARKNSPQQNKRNKSPQRQRNNSPPLKNQDKFKPYVPSQVTTPQQNKSNEQTQSTPEKQVQSPLVNTNEDHNMKPSYDQTQQNTTNKRSKSPQNIKGNSPRNSRKNSPQQNRNRTPPQTRKNSPRNTTKNVKRSKSPQLKNQDKFKPYVPSQAQQQTKAQQGK